ncbi:ankyrin [Colletotrichum caudatum]|nr:ankyrin [Colletotrichum caudatum]
MSIYQLPNEVLAMVASALEDGDLMAAASVSRRFQSVFGRQLFKNNRENGLAVLWATATGNEEALRTAIHMGVSLEAAWPRKWRSPWKNDCSPRWKVFDTKVKGYSAVHIAVELRLDKILEVLIQAGAPIDGLAPCCWRCSDEPPVHAIHDESPRWAPRTALHMAVCSRNPGAAERLMEGGASATVDGPDGPEVDGNLIPHNVRDWTILHDLSRVRAPGNAAADLIKRLVAKGLVDVGAATRDGTEPLATACAAGQYRIAIALLESGANCHARILSRPSHTILHVALDACYEMGTAPLARGTSDGYVDYLEGRQQDFDALATLATLLIQKGLNVDVTDGHGRTALHVAAKLGDVGVVDALLDEGASPALPDGAGKMALDIAKMQSRRLKSSTWSALPGISPEPESSGDEDEGFVPRRFIRLLRATEQAGVLTDQAGRRVFHIRVVWCPERNARWGRKLWLATEGATTVMQLNGENFVPRDPRLDVDLETVAVMFWATSGPPRIICQLKTYIPGNTNFRSHIVRVQFDSTADMTRFVEFCLPRVLTIEPRSQ